VKDVEWISQFVSSDRDKFVARSDRADQLLLHLLSREHLFSQHFQALVKQEKTVREVKEWLAVEDY
jgi:hypothetical protein